MIPRANMEFADRQPILPPNKF